ncbi:cytochrome c oxidase assembly protein [Gordonia neofelifaecis]|uniref:Cytochrome c oxidase assembly protein n=1 Tax=Gordonia neofelifaecis NRRL B-59395 TaxID=644548 RepID=F1YN23_9ACTN|nr:cytochrome c oxidase assembly protein [Gordonia neofelifaecis]EGD53910.1 hypothetical protein SCNU_16653 [Gordonia neofelifaecis NRRL B-59395]
MPIGELTFSSALTTWHFDLSSTLLACAAAVTYLSLARGSRIGVGSRAAFVAGCAVWWVTANGFVAVYGEVLFWVRALEFVLLTLVAGFLLAAGRPVSAIASHRRSRWTLVHLGRSRAARWLLSPLATSALMLVTPWLLFLSPWYAAVNDDPAVDQVTQTVLVLVGAVYFYARLQVDPVPRHRHAGLSLVIATAETLGDGLLGVALWQGGVLAEVVQQALQRDWGPSPRTDQTIGAGVLWVLGDVVGLPFLMFLFTRWRVDDERSADRIDAATAPSPEPDGTATTERPWFLDDPELADRLRRR